MRWLSFKHCALGSRGVRVLGPHISKMSLQVLVFERCGLCDDCCPAISSILKVHGILTFMVALKYSSESFS